MDLPLARMTHTPSSMMKITIDFDENSLIIQCNLPLSNYGRHAYRFGTCSYDPYTKVTHSSCSFSNPLYTLHSNHLCIIIVTHHTRSIVTNFLSNTSPLRWSFGGNKMHREITNTRSNPDAILLKEWCNICKAESLKAGIWKYLEVWPKGADSVTVSLHLPWRCMRIWSVNGSTM